MLSLHPQWSDRWLWHHQQSVRRQDRPLVCKAWGRENILWGARARHIIFRLVFWPQSVGLTLKPRFTAYLWVCGEGWAVIDEEHSDVSIFSNRERAMSRAAEFAASEHLLGQYPYCRGSSNSCVLLWMWTRTLLWRCIIMSGVRATGLKSFRYSKWHGSFWGLGWWRWFESRLWFWPVKLQGWRWKHLSAV